jgi:hypothetical protein
MPQVVTIANWNDLRGQILGKEGAALRILNGQSERNTSYLGTDFLSQASRGLFELLLHNIGDYPFVNPIGDRLQNSARDR